MNRLAHTPAEIPSEIAALRVVPVLELGSVEDAFPLVEALCRGGLPIAEITLRSEAGREAIPRLRQAYPDVLIGAGTVRSAEDVRWVVDAGAAFVVSPATNPELIEFCRALRIPVLPGACTPTEVDAAVRAGAEVVKFFPAEAMGGVAFLKALAGPFRDVSFVPTGGIGPGNLAEYLRLPQVLACGGSWMVAPRLLAERRFDLVEQLAREAIEIASEVYVG